MKELEHTMVLRRPGASDRRYTIQSQYCEVDVIDHSEVTAIDLRFVLDYGGGQSDFRLRIGVKDIPALLASIGDLAGGAQILANATATAVGREQDRLRAINAVLGTAIEKAEASIEGPGPLDEFSYEVWTMHEAVAELVGSQPDATQPELKIV